MFIQRSLGKLLSPNASFVRRNRRWSLTRLQIGLRQTNLSPGTAQCNQLLKKCEAKTCNANFNALSSRILNWRSKSSFPLESPTTTWHSTINHTAEYLIEVLQVYSGNVCIYILHTNISLICARKKAIRRYTALTCAQDILEKLTKQTLFLLCQKFLESCNVLSLRIEFLNERYPDVWFVLLQVNGYLPCYFSLPWGTLFATCSHCLWQYTYAKKQKLHISFYAIEHFMEE